MNNSSILICTFALGCLQACAGHSIDLDQGASSAPDGTDLVGVEVTQVPESVFELAADDARVYWTTGEEVPYEGGGYIGFEVAQSCVFDHCKATSVNYGDMEPPLTIGDQDVFFTPIDPAAPGRFLDPVVGCPKAGCGAAPNEISEDAPLYPESAAADDQYFYWSSAFDIYRCPLTGCGEVPEVVAKNEATSGGLLVDGDTVFWTFSVDASDPNGETQIHSAPKDGSRPPTLIARGVALSQYVALSTNRVPFTVDATTVYWLDGSAHVQSCPRTGCDVQAPVTLVATDGAKQSLRVDATGLYWLETADLIGDWFSNAQGAAVDHVSIRFCPLTGCATDADVRVLTPDQVGQFAMSSKYLYWDEPGMLLENGTYANGDDNKRIYRLAKPE